MDTTWTGKYIGIPFEPCASGWDGADCWGLCRLVYLTERKVALPDYNPRQHDPHDPFAVSLLIRGAVREWRRVTAPNPFDVVVLRRGNLPCHVGLYVKPGWMLHVERGREACLEEINRRWSGRIEGFYCRA